MKVHQRKWTAAQGWQTVGDVALTAAPQLVLVFGARNKVSDEAAFKEVHDLFPDPATHILMASTAGEIIGDEVLDDSLALTAIQFDKTTLEYAQATIAGVDESEAVGKKLAEQLPAEKLVHAMVYSDGLLVNGTALVRGILSGLPKDVSVTGGLVGDGPDFKQTSLGLGTAAKSGQVVLIGLYGESLRVGYGSFGGWDAFGPERTITKASGNVLYELDGEPALPLYKKYLGELASELPASGLLFPLKLRRPSEDGGAEVEVVRTILAVNEADQSITFAGDMPEGTPSTLMKANFERLIDGATQAANMSTSNLKDTKFDLALLISCVGRKLVLKQRTFEEIEAVRSVMGNQAAFTGFYSYGEISPSSATERACQLHNQTMTITALAEV